MNATTIKCKKCEITKPATGFPISERTKLYKEVCNQCRDSRYLDNPRYEELRIWFDGLSVSSNSEDINMLKCIIANK